MERMEGLVLNFTYNYKKKGSILKKREARLVHD